MYQGTKLSERVEPGELVVPEPDDPFRTGGEAIGTTAGEFWRWMLGDLRMNTTRGFLAEYLVTRAVGNRDPMRQEWAAFDVLAEDGTRIEMKASGYAQSWPGREVPITFRFGSVDKAKAWDERQGQDVEIDPDDRVHVWVFAVHETPRGAPTYDPMNLDEWSFRVVPHMWLRKCSQRQGGLSFFEQNGFSAVSWTELPEAIAASRVQHEALLKNGS